MKRKAGDVCAADGAKTCSRAAFLAAIFEYELHRYLNLSDSSHYARR